MSVIYSRQTDLVCAHCGDNVTCTFEIVCPAVVFLYTFSVVCVHIAFVIYV